MTHNKAPSAPIRTVVFDYGGVFSESPMAAAGKAAIEVGVDSDALIELMLGDDGLESHHPWQRVARGEVSLEQAVIQKVD
jgi:hypothetical protein